MEAEEDIYLVIVGDEPSMGSSGQMSAPISLKQIYLDETEGVDDLLETAERHGEYFDIKEKLKPENSEYECHEEGTILQPTIKQESNYDAQKYIPDDDEEYITEDDHDHSIYKKYQEKADIHRYTMLKPSQRRSFVAEMRQQYPELKEDNELLINILTEIMKRIKVPPLPKDYYVMDFNMLLCKVCGASTDSVPAAARHYQEKHGQRYLVCYACGVDFRSTTNLYKHEKRCASPDASVVLRARAACLGRRGRGRPYLPAPPSPRRRSPGWLQDPIEPRQPRFPCLECSAAFYNKVALQSHQYLHRGERPFQCHVCASAYTSQSALSRHTKTHSGIQFICDHCNRSFKVKASLVTHMDTHQPLRKHACEECGRRFAQKAALLQHVDRDHRHLPPPCACQMCPKRYRRMSLLKLHMMKAHGMLIITRKMFFKSLPTLTETQVKQAKVVLKSEVEPIPQDIIIDKTVPVNESNENQFDIPYNEEETNYEVNTNRELDAQSDCNEIQMDEFMQYVEMVQNYTEKDGNSQQMFIIKSGELIDMNGSLEYHKNNLVKEIESMVKVKEESIEPETGVEAGELITLSMPDL